MPQHRIHGVNQIQAGVNQRAVQIKHQQADAMRIKRAQETNHGEFRINQFSVSSDNRLDSCESTVNSVPDAHEKPQELKMKRFS